MMPDEESNRIHVLTTYVEDFRLAHCLLQLGLDSFASLQERETKFSPVTKHVALAILARETMRFRSIIELATFGYVDNMEILTRTLFEGLLAERFIFSRPRPTAKSRSPTLASYLRKLPPTPRGMRVADHRALVYRGAELIKEDHLFKEARRTSGFKRSRKETRALWVKLLDAVRSAIGQDWYTLVENQPRRYSGLSVKNQAECYGLKDMHTKLYGFQSQHAHAATTSLYMSNDETTYWTRVCGEPNKVPNSLLLAELMFILLLHDLNVSFKLDIENQLSMLRSLTHARNRSLP